jgi:hypothetical protein
MRVINWLTLAAHRLILAGASNSSCNKVVRVASSMLKLSRGEYMPADATHNSNAEWLPTRVEQSQFKLQVATYLKWTVDVLEKTERERHLPKTMYDIPVQERLHRRAS